MDKTIRMNCFVIRTAVIPAPAESQYDYSAPAFAGQQALGARIMSDPSIYCRTKRVG